MANHYSEEELLAMTKAQRREIADLPTHLEPGLGCWGCGIMLSLILLAWIGSGWILYHLGRWLFA